ncbi:uncharacterized protein LOC141852438 [Brevipalpus obovatus]|uniref:uncharacterized protein LOC141852438 n=1 Tax=Brevipalpus obovatus TaxID=246614 RepID=UPI003D9F9F82
MKKFALIFIAIVAVVYAQRTRTRTNRPIRQASAELLLPDGVEFLLAAPLANTFRCEAAGYYADIDNNCQIFHICDVQLNSQGVTEVRQYSFACGNQTIFNQLTMTCASPEESIPCELAPNFYPLNQRIGQDRVLFHTEEEAAYGAQFYPSRAARAVRLQAKKKK